MHPTRHPLASYAALAMAGFTSTVGQLILLRELTAVFYGNELVFGLILAGWLAWVAAGAWGLGPRLPTGKTPGASQTVRNLRICMVTGLAASALFLPAEVALVRASRSLLGVTPGALVALTPMLLTIVISLAPLCLLLGWLFTLGARWLSQEGGSVGGAYTAESLGAVLGGALFSLMLVRWLNPFQVALGVSALSLGIATALLMQGQGVRDAREQARGRLGRYGSTLILVLVVAALVVAAWPLGRALHWTTLAWQYPGLRFARDSIYGRIAVTGNGEQRVFFENGLLFFETQGVSAEEVAHLPLLAHPAPRRVLLIGGGVSGTLAEILRHPSVREVHYVEMDPLVVAAARSELPPDQAAPLDDPRVTLAHLDGRVYVRQQQSQSPFDVVILGLPEPATGQLNRFYTQEFFAEVRAILAPGGVFALSLPWQENYPGPALQRLAASVAQTLAAEFPELEPLPGEQLTLLASEAPLAVDPGILSKRLAERAIPTRWVVPSYLDYLLAPGRIAQAQELLRTAGPVRPNRDLEPVSYFYDLTVWLSRFSGGLSQLAAGALPLKLGWLALPLVALVVLLRLSPARLRQRRAVPVTIALTGLAGMILEVGVLLAFQVVHGYVYGQVGLIVTAFMAGLALGSALANAAARGWHRAGSLQHRWDPRHSPRAALAWIQGGIALFALGFPLVVSLAPPAGIFSLLALLGGGLTGLAFPVAVACLEVAQEPAASNGAGCSTGAIEGRPGRTAGLLYGADLVGGCVGAVTASVLLVPILGIPQTCLAVAMVGIAGLAITCL